MTSPQVMKLVEIIEDGICNRTDIGNYEEIMPKVAEVLYNRYCVVDSKIKLSEVEGV